MKTNITLKLDTLLLRKAKILSVEEGTSLSAVLAAKLEQVVREKKGYEETRKRAMARMRNAKDLDWTPPKPRDELYRR